MSLIRLATATLNFATCWGIFLAGGYLVNVLCSKDFKHGIAARILLRPPTGYFATGNLAEISGLFIQNTLLRIFRGSPFSLNSMLNCALLTLAFQALIFLVVIFKDGYSNIEQNVVQPLLDQDTIYLVMCLFLLVIIDFLSFLQTFYLMNYASRSNIVNLIFTAYADLFLSINIFTFIFPLFVGVFIVGHSSITSATGTLIYAKGIPYFNNESEREISAKLDDKVEHRGYINYLNTSFERKNIHLFQLDYYNNELITYKTTPVSIFDYFGLDFDSVPNFIEKHYAVLLRGSGLIGKDTLFPTNENFYPDNILKNIRISTVSALPFLATSLSNLASKIYFLYGTGFAVSQSVEAGMPENLLPLIASNAEFNNKSGAIDFLMQRLYVSSQPQITIICDENIYQVSSVEEARKYSCSKMVRLSKGLDGVFGGVAATIHSTMPFPFGIFLLSSLCYTVLFYVTLGIFIISYLTLRIIILILPRHIGGLLDSESVRDNSVWILLTLGGLPFSIFMAVAALAP